LKEYSGAVFFVDVLGVGALTQGKVQIGEEEFLAHGFKYKSNYSEHQFCAKLLVKFRKVLIAATENIKNVKVAQLSDCAFIWSDDPSLVVNIAREVMWKTLLDGVLCRGGLSYGQIVEPDKTNTRLGKFICGSASTQAVKLEEAGKGARVFIDPNIVTQLNSVPHTAFIPRKSPMDFSITDEFLWYRYPNKIVSIYDDQNIDRNAVLEGLVNILIIIN